MFKAWINETVNTELCKSVYDYLQATSQSEKQAVERFCAIYKEFRGDQFGKYYRNKAPDKNS